MRLYNTLTRRVEEFRPARDNTVRMYTCGLTVYARGHIGNFRTFTCLDVLRRTLKYQEGWAVRQVMNFTDVDDRTIAEAARAGVPLREYTDRYIAAFLEDAATLGLEPVEEMPRATDEANLRAMTELIAALERNGHTYRSEGSIYFRIATLPGYGRLSRLDVAGIKTGARVDADKYSKEDARDFVLWKATRPGEPTWDFGLGPGRPGWHIECSAMSMKYLGESFDIHGGGEDLIFPHHENEIAQSEALTGKPFARYWIHNGFVKIRQEKMSKSLGNVFTIRELLDRYSPGALKLFLLSTHYRSPVDFTEEKLEEAEKAAERIQTLLRRIADLEAVAKVWPSPSPMGEVEGFRRLFEAKQTAFEEAMDDDFNTAQALGVLFEVVEVLNRLCDRLISRGIGVASEDLSLLRQGKALVHRVGDVFGLSFKASPNESFYSSISGIAEVDQALESSKRAILTKRFEEAVEIIGGLLKRREQVRAAGLYEEADRIRRELEAMGIKVDDTRFFTAVTTPFPSGPQGSLYVTLIKDENFSPSSAKDG